MITRFGVISFLIGCSVQFAYPQVAGRITGSVTDSSGAPIPGATVNVTMPGSAAPLFATTTNADGLFDLVSVRPQFYDVTIESKGFQKYTARLVKVDPGRETPLPRIKLELATVTETVEVVAAPESIQVNNAEISTTVTNQQVERLPMLDRSPASLILTQPGVSNGRGPTVINGQRTSYSNVTLDGINIQDNYIRSNGLDYQPNLLLLDQVEEFTVTTSNANSTIGGGTSQVTFVTPHGTNQLHGALYWYNRNNAAAATDWFDNKDGIKKAFLNQNQIGGKVGGPIKHDKLFFYTNYEAFRNRQKSSVDRSILTTDARNGIFTYRDNQGNVRKVNILQARGVGIDPAIQRLIDQIPTPDKINNFRAGDSSASLLRNTAGYSFQASDNRTRDNVTTKLDYNLSSKHSMAGSYIWNRDVLDRSDLSNDYSVAPKVTNDNHSHFLSLQWRWSPSATFTNEARGGLNLAPGNFLTTEKFGDFLIDGLVFSNPVNQFRAQGRATDTYAFMNNSSWVRGRHTFQFGYQMQKIRVATFDDGGITPTYFLGIGTGQTGLTGGQLPGIGGSDFAAANSLLATLGGFVDQYDQIFNVTTRTSGFVPGASNLRHLSFDGYAEYFLDTWKIRKRLTLTFGLRYEYMPPVDERDALELMPVLGNGNFVTTLLADSTLDFAGKAVGRPFYKSDRNNFAPGVGLAWDVFGSGRTAVRGGYSIAFVNDEHIQSVENSVFTNDGLVGESFDIGLDGRISTGRPPIVKADYKVPRKFSDNFEFNPATAHAMPDPTLRTPYVQQYAFGIQHEYRGNVFELRYVGAHATKQFRAFDLNQINIKAGGFLDDFIRARNNGFLARDVTGVFDPRFNPSVPGSQRLPVFAAIDGGGFLTNAAVRGLIERGEVANLGSLYFQNLIGMPVSPHPNPNTNGANIMTNYSNSTYNSLQFDMRRRLRQGLQLQGNYTFAKVLSDAAGDNQVRFEPFIDNANPKIERARAPFDLRHNIKANGIYELPLGKGHRLNARGMSKVLGGWSVSGIMSWQSGIPISVLSARGTFNRGSRAANNTANTTLSASQLNSIIDFRMTGDGPYMIAASAIGTDGRGVAPDGRAAFSGQTFFNPGPGEIGTLQRRRFSGPWVFSLNSGIQKSTKFGERHDLQFRMESDNILNHPTFFPGDLNVNSTQFGRIASTFYARRVIQFGLYYKF